MLATDPSRWLIEMRLKNRIALITGGGRGIGKAIATALVADGASVVLAAPEWDEVKATADELNSAGHRALPIQADVTQVEQVDAAIATARVEMGPPDILVNNAGIAGATARVDQISPESWNETIAVNLTGAFLCARAVAPEMIERGSGNIVNISSVAGKIGYALRTPYAASKWGLIGLSHSLANELGEYGIRVNAVCPGPVDGPRMQAVFEGRAAALNQPVGAVKETYLQTMALRRMVKSENVAATVVFLASDDSESITGQAVDVSCGYQL